MNIMRSLRRLDEHHFVRQHRIYRTRCIINSDDRSSDRLIDMCAGAGIAFIPWYPLAPGTLASPDSPLVRIAQRLGATPSRAQDPLHG
jgi:aryl-alcohol dehydrogenase-like predicted oxidoreductase